MARTPLMQALRRAIHLARISNRPGAPPADELVEMARRERAHRISRRQMLKGTMAGAAGLAIGGSLAIPERVYAQARSGAPKIVIVGGGVAGLHAAHLLKKGGIGSAIFEASNRTGGRMFTGKDLMGPGLTTELGGEFVDSGHEDMMNLIKEFNLELIDVQGEGESALKAETCFFDGKHYTEEELVEAFKPLAKKIDADLKDVEEVVDHENEGGGGELDKLSIAAYLDKIGASGALREILEVCFVTEYGLEPGEQSCLNMLFMLSTDTSEGKLALLGDSDERFKIKGGNQRVCDELSKGLEKQIRKQHRLLAVQSAGSGYKLTFEGPGRSTAEVSADVVIMTIPFTMLREVTLKVDMPDIKKKAIKELGYGMNAKVMAGFQKRIWREQGFSGNTYSDEPFQLAWDNSRLQDGEVGGITFYSGGKAAMEVGKGTPKEQAERLMPGLEKAYPGVTAIQSGAYQRFHWPTHEFTKAAYACYKPGQWTSIAGAEIKPVGNLFFAGEHCSYDFQGFMNGGAETGRRAAEAILEKLGKKKEEKKEEAA